MDKPQNIILSETGQSWKDKYCTMPLTQDTQGSQILAPKIKRWLPGTGGRETELLFIEYRASVCKDEKVLDGGDTTAARQTWTHSQCHWTGHSSVADATHFLTMTPTTEWCQGGSSRVEASVFREERQAGPQLEAALVIWARCYQSWSVPLTRGQSAVTRVRKECRNWHQRLRPHPVGRQQRQAGHVHAWQVLRGVHTGKLFKRQAELQNPLSSRSASETLVWPIKWPSSRVYFSTTPLFLTHTMR